MPEYKRLPLDVILVGQRQRKIDPSYARVIGLSMAEHGQLQPIAVRATPAAERPYTLVLGGHRYTGAGLNNWAEIDAVVVKGDSSEAQMMEIAENLHRNDLTVLDRAIFVQTYRDLWEAKYGKIKRGGDQSAKFALCSTEGVSGFSEFVASQLGLSKRSAQYLNKINQNLHPRLRAAICGTPTANNQSELLKLARRGPSEQAGIASALYREPDLKKVLAAADGPKARPTHAAKQAAILSTLRNAWKDADQDTRRAFLDEIGDLEDFSFLEAAE